MVKIPSNYLRHLSGKMLIPEQCLQIMDCIGQGVCAAAWTHLPSPSYPNSLPLSYPHFQFYRLSLSLLHAQENLVSSIELIYASGPSILLPIW